MPAWLLPDHIADVLPAQAEKIEALRRLCLDCARTFGYELIMPPMLEYVDSLLSGTGRDLDLKTFKLTDQLSGKTMGVRADITAQAARIDAHLLNRSGVVRLCYAGSVLHSQAHGALSSRELLQFGAEIYGHPGLEAELEVLQLALACLAGATPARWVVDLADARIVRALLAGAQFGDEGRDELLHALTQKDAATVASLVDAASAGLAPAQRASLKALPALYGDVRVLKEAERALPDLPAVRSALRDISRVARMLPEGAVNIDLADLRGYHYYTGLTFAVYVQGMQAALLRGGRYDEVGAAFGRARPAAGFSMDLRELQAHARPEHASGAVRAPCSDDAQLAQAMAALRGRGEVVIQDLPGHAPELAGFAVDRILHRTDAGWVVKAIEEQ